MASLRQAQKEMTRRLLLSTSLELFRAKGYAATTIDDIASHAGTTRVTFYAYFPSKAHVARALLAELNTILERAGSEPRGSSAAALADAVADGSRDALTAWLRSRAQLWDMARPFLNAVTEAGAVDQELRGMVQDWFEEVVVHIKDGLDRADRFDPSVRHARATLAMAQLDHVGQHWSPGDWGIDQEQLVQLLADAWFTLLGSTPG